jgi:hypothetical protein
VTDWSDVLSGTYSDPSGLYSYMKDQVGTIYKVFDHNARAVAETRAYDMFGNLISRTGTEKTRLGFQEE